MKEEKRKGARSTKDIDPKILIQLNKGEIETANLVEWLAVDQTLILENVLKAHQKSHYLNPILEAIDGLKKKTVNTVNEAIGMTLFQEAVKENKEDFLVLLQKHTSDVVRVWSSYPIGRNPMLSLAQKLEQLKPFAADPHFGVREISWMTVRPSIIKNLSESIAILSTWTADNDENVRRFATEATRPRGVWCDHIEALKTNPELAISILEPLKADKAKYVQNSVANWLNDASKTQPDFVRNLCAKWQKASQTKETQYIIKKALRTLDKA